MSDDSMRNDPINDALGRYLVPVDWANHVVWSFSVFLFALLGWIAGHLVPHHLSFSKWLMIATVGLAIVMAAKKLWDKFKRGESWAIAWWKWIVTMIWPATLLGSIYLARLV